MEPVSLYKNKCHVQLRDVDFTKKLKLSALFSYLQDTASLAVDNLGIGIDRIGKVFDVAWILIRIRVDIIRNPSWNEEITIETWPQQPKKLEFERDYIVRDENGNIIIKAVSTWVIIDIDSRKIRKSDLIAIDYPEFIKERAIDCSLGKLRQFGNMEVAYKKVIGYSDVDFNGHLNNSKYVDYIADCFTIDNYKRYNVKSIEVDYLNEALPGDTLILNRDVSGINANVVYIEGVNEKDNKIVFKSQVEIEENKDYGKNL